MKESTKTNLKELKFCVAIFLMVIIVAFQWQLIENWRIKITEIENKGKLEVQTEATRLGYARYEGTDFTWNTNLFNSIGRAIDCVLESEQRSKEMSAVCLKMAQMSIKTGEMVTQIEKEKRNVPSR